MRCPFCPQRGGLMKKTNMSIKSQIFQHSNPYYDQFLQRCIYKNNCHKTNNNYNSFNEDDNYNSSNTNSMQKQLRNKRISKIYLQKLEEDSYTQNYNSHFFYDYNHEPMSTDIWIHVSCYKYFYQFINPPQPLPSIEPVLDIDALNLDEKKFYIQCQICKQKKAGVCASCSSQKCANYFHVQCAINHNCYINIDNQNNKFEIFCDKHAPLNLLKIYELNEMNQKQQILKFIKSIEKIESQCEQKGKKQMKKQYIEDDKQFEYKLMRQLKKRQEFQFVIVLQKYETGKGTTAYQFNHLRLPKPLILKLQISQKDGIWNQIKFKNYSGIKLYRKYRTLVKKYQQNCNQKDRLNRLQYKKQQKVYQNDLQDNNLYCLCRQKYKLHQQMIMCELCDEWFHFQCIGFLGTSQEASRMDQYICKSCECNDSVLNKERRKSKYKHLFLENQKKLDNNQIQIIKNIKSQFEKLKSQKTESSESEEESRKKKNKVSIQ